MMKRLTSISADGSIPTLIYPLDRHVKERQRSLIPTKRTFDLCLAVFVGGYAAMTGVRLWATRYLNEGKPGALYSVAQVTKAVTG